MIDMPRMSKTQKKRMITDILRKTNKLYMDWYGSGQVDYIVSTKDMEAIDKLCKKWMKRVG